MKILLTGGAGFIGSHVVDAYLEAGHEVVVVDDLSTGSLANLNPRAKFYQVDICDPAIAEVFAAEKPDLVNHHAAQISVPNSIQDPLSDVRVNVSGFLNILENCVKYNIKKVIFISSGGAIYGEAKEYPSKETTPLDPLSIYGINKLTGERYLRFYQYKYGLAYTVLRYANVYGPRQQAQGEAGVVALFISQLLRGEIPEVLSYPDAPEGMIRDYVFVADVVRANLAALTEGANDVFNIGTGVETTTSMLFKTIAWQLGKDPQSLSGPPRSGDLRRSLLESKKAFQKLGWSPIFSLDAGIRETIQYLKNKVGTE